MVQSNSSHVNIKKFDTESSTNKNSNLLEMKSITYLPQGKISSNNNKRLNNINE